jgi:hypothetical protein
MSEATLIGDLHLNILRSKTRLKVVDEFLEAELLVFGEGEPGDLFKTIEDEIVGSFIVFDEVGNLNRTAIADRNAQDPTRDKLRVGVVGTERTSVPRRDLSLWSAHALGFG